MRIYIVLSFAFIMSLFSCSKEKHGNKRDPGVPTVLKGRVVDTIRGINIEGYKIVIVKETGTFCAGWECSTQFETVATGYTDFNGDYSITFNYNSQSGKGYYLMEQYYGIPYYPEYFGRTDIIEGRVNTVNINAWRPIVLKLTVDVLNNKHAPLTIGNKLFNSNSAFFNTESVYEQNTKKTYSLRTRPNTDINIAFWYCADGAACRDLRQKIIPFRTNLDDTISLNYSIDCSTF